MIIVLAFITTTIIIVIIIISISRIRSGQSEHQGNFSIFQNDGEIA